MSTSWVPGPALAKELGVSRRTIGRWATSDRFPAPKVFNRRLYFRRDEIEAWKAGLVRDGITRWSKTIGIGE